MSHEKAVKAYNEALDECMKADLECYALGVLQECFRRTSSDEELAKVVELLHAHLKIWAKTRESA